MDFSADQQNPVSLPDKNSACRQQVIAIVFIELYIANFIARTKKETDGNLVKNK